MTQRGQPWRCLGKPGPRDGRCGRGFRAIGADPLFGLELPALLASARLDQVAADITFSLVHGGSTAAQFYGLSLEELGDRLIAAGLLSQQDVDTLEEFHRQPASRWFSIGLVSAIGRRAG